MTYKICLLPGDGIGPEVIAQAEKVLRALPVKLDFAYGEIGYGTYQKVGTPLPDETLEKVRSADATLFGAVTTPPNLPNYFSAIIRLRQTFELYANLRPCKSFEHPSSRPGIDLLVVRENTEDLYAGIEFQRGTDEMDELVDFINRVSGTRLSKDAAISIKYISVVASRRIAKFAFEYARANNRRKVTAVHKANIMKFSDGLFLSSAQEVAKDYPDIQFEDRIVDNMCMQLVQKPELYDVLVLPNLYGDILSDLSAGLIGGLGVAPGANIGAEYAVFEPVHGSAPKYAGLNKVNPMAMMFSGVLMLRHLREKQAANRLEAALASVIAEGRFVTYDLKPRPDDPTAVGTSQVADAVIARMAEIA